MPIFNFQLNKMKRIILISSIVLAVIIIFLFVTPLLLKGKLEKNIKSAISKDLNATVAWDGFSLSMFRHFPKLSVEMNKLSVATISDGSTLLNVENIIISTSLFDAFRGSDFKIKSCLINRPVLSMRINADSVANWDISKTAIKNIENTNAKKSGKPDYLPKSIEINNASILFSDEAKNIITNVDGLNLKIAEKKNSIDVSMNINDIDFTKNDIYYIKNIPLAFDANLGIDWENSSLKFNENTLLFNKIPVQFAGGIAKSDNGFDVDMNLDGKETEFKTLLAFMPDEYAKRAGEPETKGSFIIEGEAKGVFIDLENFPAYNLLIEVNDGFLHYPDKAKSIDNIRAEFSIKNPYGTPDSTVIQMNGFHFELDNNPFDMALYFSNDAFNANMIGTIDFAALKEALPLDVEINGVANSNLSVEGDYAMLEAEQYDKIKSEGNIKLKDFEFINSDFPAGVRIDDADISFLPKYAELKSFTGKVGVSDFSIKGKVENYLGYILKDGVLKGKFTHHTKMLNTNELMRVHHSKNNSENDSINNESSGKILVSPNLDIEMASRFDKILFDKLELNNTTGTVKIRDSKVILDGLKTGLLNGQMVMTGEYDTRDISKPSIDFNILISSIDVNMAGKSFTVVETMAPIVQNARGSVSGNLKLKGLISNGLSLMPNTLNGSGTLKSGNIEISESNVQKALSAMLKDQRYNLARISDLNMNFNIENGDITVKPFDVDFSGKKVNIAGRQMLDRTIDYNIKIPFTRNEINSVTGLLGIKLPPVGNNFIVGILVTGTTNEPDLKFDLDNITSQLETEYKDEIEKVTKTVEKLLEDPEVRKKVEDVGKQLRRLFE